MDGKKAMETVSELLPGIFFTGVLEHNSKLYIQLFSN
jgi:hypothetical protein